MTSRAKKPTRRIPPKLEEGLTSAELPRDDIVDDALLCELDLRDLELTNRHARLVDVEACAVTGCTFAGSEIGKLSVSDTRFERCDLANVVLQEAAFNRVEFRGCRLTGATWAAASIRHVAFVDCLADMSSFRFVSTLALEFVDCRFQRADFGSADISGARFERCDLTGAEFSSARATKAVFVDCTWGGIRGVTGLAGATVANGSPIDTLTFTAAMAGGLGITLAHPSELVERDDAR